MPRNNKNAHGLDLSIVVPLFNESGTFDELHRRLASVLLVLGLDHEIIYVDDGGFDAAAGDVIIAMDGDLQHAPEEIPTLLAKLDDGYDIVSGWREQRVDNLWTRRLPSKMANWMMAKLSGVSLHDFGTTFKAYRAPVIKRIRLHGDLHRFIPALASWGGARIAEVPIANIPRPQNQSHYGLSRTWRVAADLITVRFLLRAITPRG